MSDTPQYLETLKALGAPFPRGQVRKRKIGEPRYDVPLTLHEFQSMPSDEVFWHYVRSDATGCWIWEGSKSRRYGRFYMVETGKFKRVNRYVLEIVIGRELVKDEFACHRCDEPLCVNPDHLFVGTAAENNRDRSRKGRSAQGDNHPSRIFRHLRPRGEHHSRAKLTDNQVAEIKLRIANGERLVDISKDYPVTKDTISKINRGVAWGHIEAKTA